MKLLDECANVILTGSVNGGSGAVLPLEYTFELDLRSIMGNQMYDNYDYFGITFNSVGMYNVVSSYSTTLPQGVVVSGGSSTLKLRIQGLPVVKSTTNGKVNSISSGTYFPNLFNPGGTQGTGFVPGAFRISNFPNSRKNAIMFCKPQSSVVTITLTVRNIVSLDSVFRAGNSTNPLQNTSRFSFSIFPAVEE